MEKYNYYTAMYNDVLNYVLNSDVDLTNFKENVDYVFEALEEELWGEDSVTGNGGNGYDTEEKCEEYICHNLDLLLFAIDDLGYDMSYKNINKPNLAVRLDSIIRLYLLNQVLWDVLENLDEE